MHAHTFHFQWCGLRPSVLGQDRSETKKIGLGLLACCVVLVLVLQVWCYDCETGSCHARRHNDLEGPSNFSSTIYSFSILCLEQLWRSTVAFTITSKLNPPSAFVYFRWSWSCYFGLKNLVLFSSLRFNGHFSRQIRVSKLFSWFFFSAFILRPWTVSQWGTRSLCSQSDCALHCKRSCGRENVSVRDMPVSLPAAGNTGRGLATQASVLETRVHALSCVTCSLHFL